MPETTPEQQRQAAENARKEGAPKVEEKTPQTTPNPQATAGSPTKLQTPPATK